MERTAISEMDTSSFSSTEVLIMTNQLNICLLLRDLDPGCTSENKSFIQKRETYSGIQIFF